jgi:hypothetical protein
VKVKIGKCAFKNISNVAVVLNERRESVGNIMSSELWGKESGKVEIDEIDWKVGLHKNCSCCCCCCGGGGGISSSSSSSNSISVRRKRRRRRKKGRPKSENNKWIFVYTYLYLYVG